MTRNAKLVRMGLLGASLLAWSACDLVGARRCEVDTECRPGEVCQQGRCEALGQDLTLVACHTDAMCQAIDPRLICNPTGLCDLPVGGGPCTITADCPIDQFCNYQSEVCVRLQPGFCREAEQCPSGQCAAPEGGMGRCAECASGADCASGTCLSNGACATGGTCDPPCAAGLQCNLGQCVAIAGDCNPPCLSSEECVQGVCYEADGCPRHAHPVSGQCVCDDGYVPNPAGNACVPEGSCDADAQRACQLQGGVWDATNCVCLSGGACTPPCPAGSACQGGTCVPVTGACSSDLDCMGAGPGFFSCDQASASCVCDALQGILMCVMFGIEFSPDRCDCVWEQDLPDAGTGGRDSGAAPDRGGSRDAGTSTDAAGARDAQIPPGAPPGSPCVEDTDCGGYSAAWCVTHWPGGYCGGRCDADRYQGECGVEGLCVCIDQGFTGCLEAYCYQGCDDVSDCRQGYACKTSSAGIAACVPE